jgi:hypothetical protein
MGFKEAFEGLTRSNVYKEWAKENEGCYLVYGFFMEDKEIAPEWQIGFYDEKADQVTTFVISDKITKNPESDALKKEGRIDPLDREKVELDFVDVLETANKVQREEYPQHTPMKKIFIVQTLEGKTVWNITFISQTFNTLNIKIDATTGAVISKKLLSIFRVEK